MLFMLVKISVMLNKSRSCSLEFLLFPLDMYGCLAMLLTNSKPFGLSIAA